VEVVGVEPAAPAGINSLQAIRHHWRAIVMLVVIAVAAALFFSSHAGTRYDAESVLVVTPLPASDDALITIGVYREPGSGAATSVYALSRLLTTPGVVDGAKARLGEKSASRSAILQNVAIKPAQQSATVSIVGSATSPTRAARIANAFADTVMAQRGAAVQRDLRTAIGRLRARLASAAPQEAVAIQSNLAELVSFLGAGDPTVRVLTPAVPPDKPASTGRLLSILVALIAALAVGVGLAYGLELLLPRLRSDDEALQRVPVLADVPRASRVRVRQYLNGGGTLPGDLWEAYRILRASLSGRANHTVLVTSAIQGEGKTTTAVNLAIALAASGQRVVLVDGDLRRPAVGRVFGIPPETGGFADLLFRRARARDVLVAAPGYGEELRLLLPGGERPLDLLEPGRIRSMLTELRNDADVVVVDSPALTEYADAISLAKGVDTVLVAVLLGRTRRDRFAELIRRFEQEKIKPAGFVVIGRSRSSGASRARLVEAESSAGGDDLPPARTGESSVRHLRG
jgi:Mrp family chromosome partitioning ATPase